MSVEGIPETVRRSMKILATHRALFGSRRTMGRTLSELEISRVVSVFESNRAAWALVGAHAVNLLTEPRSTADFDFVVESGKLDAILRDLGEAFGDLQARNLEGVIRLSAIDVDLIPSDSHSLSDEALRQVRMVSEWKVPRTEVLIALKFLVANRRRDRDQRAYDLIHGICHRVGADQLDREEIIRLGGLAYPGAERELRALLDKIDRGEPLSI
jgi:hypothetical protein